MKILIIGLGWMMAGSSVLGVLGNYSNEFPYTPEVAGKELVVRSRVVGDGHHGVVVAHGGSQDGYALAFEHGRPVFHVRRDGKLTTLRAEETFGGTFQVEARLTGTRMSLHINDKQVAVGKSPGLLEREPRDPFSVGYDAYARVGDYADQNAFNNVMWYATVNDEDNSPDRQPLAGRKELLDRLEGHAQATLVHNWWIRDPYIVLGPDDHYYLTGTTRGRDFVRPGGVDASAEGKVHVWKSPNLVDWEYTGSVYSLRDGIWYQLKRQAFDAVSRDNWKIWAPELHWSGERWMLVHTSPSPVDAANFSISGGPDLAGPWLNPLGSSIRKRHDPSLFRDGDGSWWLVWGFHGTRIVRLKDDFSDLDGSFIRIGPTGAMDIMGHEGYLIKKIMGKYVLFGTAWSTNQMRRGSYNLYYATADLIEGPYSQRKFVGRFLGHGTPFQDKAGQWWCTAFYNANIPPLPLEGIQKRDLRMTAQTINQIGTTLVPLEVIMDRNSELIIRAVDPDYAIPGPDEWQDFNLERR